MEHNPSNGTHLFLTKLTDLAMGQNPLPPVNIPILTKIDYIKWLVNSPTNQNAIPKRVKTHSQMLKTWLLFFCISWASHFLRDPPSSDLRSYPKGHGRSIERGAPPSRSWQLSSFPQPAAPPTKKSVSTFSARPMPPIRRCGASGIRPVG